MFSAKRLALVLYILILLLFCYFRVKPIYFQTVAYTYDQGRDFLRAQDFILNKNIPLIGPTTGLGGLFHGAWWYYFLGASFLIFGGTPQGYYVAAFLLQLVSFIVFSYFIKKNFGWITTYIAALLIAISPYFISTSTVIANNILVIPFLIGFIIINSYLLQDSKFGQKKYILVLLGFFCGMIAESELAFGFLLIPSYIILILLIKELRKNFLQLPNIAKFLGGFILAVIPRIIFEVTNFFPEGRALFRFFKQPSFHNPKQYSSLLQDRYNTFFEYYRSIFASNTLLFLFSLSFLVILVLYLTGSKQNKSSARNLLFAFLASFLVILFFFSTLFNDTFWSYYLEGIQYIYLVLFGFILSFAVTGKSYLTRFIKFVLLLVLVVSSISLVVKDSKNPPSLDGLLVQKEIVKYITTQEGKNISNYCVRIYTPPVIPYTYDYLFAYNNRVAHVPSPKNEWVNNTCWFVIEEDIENRVFQWRERNIPTKAKRLKGTVIKGTRVELWKR